MGALYPSIPYAARSLRRASRAALIVQLLHFPVQQRPRSERVLQTSSRRSIASWRRPSSTSLMTFSIISIIFSSFVSVCLRWVGHRTPLRLICWFCHPLLYWRRFVPYKAPRYCQKGVGWKDDTRTPFSSGGVCLYMGVYKCPNKGRLYYEMRNGLPRSGFNSKVGLKGVWERSAWRYTKGRSNSLVGLHRTDGV